MATITKSGIPYKWGTYDQNNGFFWSGYSSIHVSYWTAAAYAFGIDNGTTLTGASIEVTIDQTRNPGSAYSCTLWGDESGYVEQYATQSFTAPSSGRVTHKFTFSGLSKTPDEIYFTISPTARNAEANLTTYPPITATLNVPNLTAGVTPSSLYAGNTIKADFTNRLGEALTVQVFYNTTLLYSTTVSSDSINIRCPESWFGVAGVTGNSMGLKLRASDSLGRTSNDATFTLRRATGGTISPTAPRSTTLDGTASINFAWNYSGDGTLTKTELQWSRDNAAWTDLATVSGNETSWTAPAISFPAGTIYWRARATNSFGIVGAWSNSVSFTVRYAAVSQTVPVNSPTSGAIIATQPQSFQIALEASAPVYELFSVDSATFFWRAGEAGNYTSTAMTPNGNSASVTIPAGTFPSGSIQWYASSTDNTGRTTQTDIFTLSTLNAVVEAVPLAPNNTVENNTGDIIFSWDFLSLDGGVSAGAQLQKSADGTNWSDLASVPAGLNSIAVPGSGFAAGRVFWRVRAENASGVWSEWSVALSFQVFGAPIIASITGDGKPFLTVRWQTEGQLAYKIEIDGQLYGPYRSETARSFTLPLPLPDGIHVLKVAAQNQYGLWSSWAEANVSIDNIQGPAITIDAEWQQDESIRVAYQATVPPEIVKTIPETVIIDTGNYTYSALDVYDPSNQFQWYKRSSESQPWEAISGATGRTYTVNASWSNNGQYQFKVYNAVGEVYSNISTFTYDSLATRHISDIYDTDLYPETGHFLIYRDGSLIGKTRRNSFLDRTALGAHEYFVIQALAGGYYTKSNTVTLSTEVRCPMIALLSGGEFLVLELSAEADRSQTITKGGEVLYIQYSGAKYPEAEVGEAESLTATGDVSFTAEQETEARRFEAMLKKPVIYKTPGGEVVVGVLQGFTRRDPRFFKSYRFTVTQMEWRDYTNA